MKKLLIILSSILSICIFYTVYNTEAYNNFVSTTNANSEIVNHIGSSIYLKSNSYSKTDVVEELYRIADEHESYMFQGDLHLDSFGNSVYTYYIAGSLRMPYVMREGKDIDLKSNSGSYLTTDKYDDNANGYIDVIDEGVFLSEKTIVQVHPLIDVLYTERGLENIWIYSKDDAAIISSMKKSNILSESFDLDNINQLEISDDVKSNDNQLLILLIVGTTSSILITFLSEIAKRKKEIALRKLNGQSDLRITSKMFGRNILLALASFLVLQVVISYIFMGSPREITYIIISKLSNYLFLFITLLIVIFILSFVYVKTISSIEFLKKSEINYKVIYFNLLLKTIIVISMFTPFVYFLDKGVSSINALIWLNKHGDIVYHGARLSGFKHYDELQSKGYEYLYEVETNLVEFMENSGALFLTHMPIFSDLDRDKNEDQLYLYSNKNFMMQQNIVDEENISINFDEISQTTLFVPLKLKNEYTYENGYCSEGCQIRYIKDKQVIAPLIPPYPFVDLATENTELHDEMFSYESAVIKVIYPLTAEYQLSNNNGYIINLDTISMEDLEDGLKGLGLERYLHFDDTRVEYSRYQRMHEVQATKFIFLLLVYTSTIGIFIYQYIYIFFDENKKILAIKYLNGIGLLRSYKELFVVFLLDYIVSFSILFLLSNQNLVYMTLYILVLLTFELLITVILIKRNEKNSITILKGE